MKRSICLLFVFAFLIGCSPTTKQSDSAKKDPTKEAVDEESAAVAAARAKLSPEDLALVQAQEWCVVQNEGRLGSMGVPKKLMIKDQPVFICCGHCKRKAEADPDATIAKLDQLKAKAKKKE